MMVRRMFVVLAATIVAGQEEHFLHGSGTIAHLSTTRTMPLQVLAGVFKVGAYQRESLKLDYSAVKKLERAQASSQLFRMKLNACFQSKVPQSLPPSMLFDGTSESERDDPHFGMVCQADMTVCLKHDAYLSVLLQTVIDNPASDVIAVMPGPAGSVDYKQVRVKQHEYISFEMAETPDKVCEKIYQLSRLCHVLKDEFIGEQARIAATGILVNGKREDFELGAEVVRSFLSEAKADPDLCELFDWQVPMFVCYAPIRTDLDACRSDIELLRSQMADMRSRDETLRYFIRNALSEYLADSWVSLKSSTICVLENLYDYLNPQQTEDSE
ncbi:hypothetical protein GUITHDRAFT_109752 [Guillardia theta CCMP2712]|uniref:Uncharacterized protein n=1 Tax=Guillardia theta (strain CCMP2712) TaxID=905079 RepID=L1J7L9_GUITC|nr:hypothetical protein GUITHDRAFT_109752 [Guillardia theta CCMP2712]EKX44297.1 hypothetical protein GUITHDRAFT_109752 [Guillardia theta CCMP2712]|eukprot:XP_005831277.1 hypothetical protein GUITHDRAFT_109752 [Guillardia theta CCMP2712]